MKNLLKLRENSIDGSERTNELETDSDMDYDSVEERHDGLSQ